MRTRVLWLVLILSVGMLFSNISIWELNCYKWEGRQGEMYGRIQLTLSSSLIKAYNWRLSSKNDVYGQFRIMDITFSGQYFLEKKIFSHMLLFKVPVSSIFLFSYLILYIAQWISVKKIDLDKMQSLLEVSKTFKVAAILVHHSHQSSLVSNGLWRRWRNTWLKAWLISLVLPL